MNLNDDRGPGLRIFCILMIIVPSVAVSLRLWSRALGDNSRQTTIGRFWWDDWTCLVAWALLVGVIATMGYLVELGLGQHLMTISLDRIVKISKILFTIQLVYLLGIALAKSSALFFYQRVFDHAGSRARYAIWITQALNCAWWITFSAEDFAHCQPIQKFWTPTMKEGFCLNTHSIYLGNAVTAVTVDLLILLIPMPLLWRLKLSMRRKVLVTLVFVLGYGVIVVSIGRLVQVYVAGDALVTDLTYAGVPVYYWFIAEAAIALTSICLPAIWSLFVRVGRHGPLSLLSRTKYSSIDSKKTGGLASNSIKPSGAIILQSHPTSSTKSRSVDKLISQKSRSLDEDLEYGDCLQQPVAPAQIRVTNDVSVRSYQSDVRNDGKGSYPEAWSQ